MKLLALETDREKLIKRFCHEDEVPVYITHYHGMSFFFAIIREMFITVGLVGIGVGLWMFDFFTVWAFAILFAMWMIFVFFNVMKSYIDWSYDMIVVTTDKLILIDQTSVIKNEIRPIHIENVGSVNTFTQFWGIFPFGAIQINLKEGLGGDDVVLKFVPRAEQVAAKISEVVTYYQRFVDGGASRSARRDVRDATKDAS